MPCQCLEKQAALDVKDAPHTTHCESRSDHHEGSDLDQSVGFYAGPYGSQGSREDFSRSAPRSLLLW